MPRNRPPARRGHYLGHLQSGGLIAHRRDQAGAGRLVGVPEADTKVEHYHDRWLWVAYVYPGREMGEHPAGAALLRDPVAQARVT